MDPLERIALLPFFGNHTFHTFLIPCSIAVPFIGNAPGFVGKYILPDSLVFCSSTASLWSQIPTPFATQTAMNTEGLFTAFIASRIMVELGLFDPYSWGI